MMSNRRDGFWCTHQNVYILIFFPLARPPFDNIRQLGEGINMTIELRSNISTLKTKAVPGLDDITVSHFQSLPDAWLTQLAYIFNTSTLLGFFPDPWKVGRLVTIQNPRVDPNSIMAHRILTHTNQCAWWAFWEIYAHTIDSTTARHHPTLTVWIS